MSHHLGLQQKPLKGCFRVRTLGPNPFPYPLSQQALAGAAKPQFKKKKKQKKKQGSKLESSRLLGMLRLQ